MNRQDRLAKQIEVARNRARYDIKGSSTLYLLRRAAELIEQASLILDHCVKQKNDFPQHTDWLSCCHPIRHNAHAAARFLFDISVEIPERKKTDTVCESTPKGRLYRDPNDVVCHNPLHPGYGQRQKEILESIKKAQQET